MRHQQVIDALARMERSKILRVLVFSLSALTMGFEGKCFQSGVVVEKGGKVENRFEGDDLCRLASILGGKKEVIVEGIQMVLHDSPSAEDYPNKPKAAVQQMQRALLGSGAHREVQTEITVELQLFDQEITAEDCEVILLEKLSAGVFADLFQLQRLQQQDAFKAVHIYGDMDLERPAKNSFQSLVEIHQRLLGKEFSSLKEGHSKVLLQSNVTLPLHARYPPTSPDTHFVLNITRPEMVIYCKERGRGDTSAVAMTTAAGVELCIPALNGQDQTLQWLIPSGYPQHSSWVMAWTSVVALAGVAVILVVLRFSNFNYLEQLESRGQ